MTHGVGRSGELGAVQPKAAGSTLVAKITQALVKHAFEIAGLQLKACIVMPCATGLSCTLVFLTLKQHRPVIWKQAARYVVWSRIDQKTCLKCIISAGLEPLIVPTRLVDDYVTMGDLSQVLSELDPTSVLCVFTTTSCFAPRQADPVVEVSRLCKELDIPHVINNAYGVQCSKLTHLVSQAAREGRVDAVVQSCDKNFCVPVGGAIVASNSKAFIKQLSEVYPGRASASSSLDMLITLLGLGESGWRSMLQARKALSKVLEEKLQKLAIKFGERVIKVPKNTISFGLTLTCLGESSTKLGASLYTRRVSGARVTVPSPPKQVFGYTFSCYGSSYEDYPVPYIAVACSVGLKAEEVDLFVERFDKTLSNLIKSS